jgi:hypothetical protein
MEATVTDRNRTDAIDRYLNGGMSDGELARFSEQLVSDPKLRSMLDAEELIRGTIRRDLAAIPSKHPGTEAHVMGTLAALTSSARNGAMIDPGPNVGGGGSSFFGSGSAMKMIVGAVVGAGILTGAYMLIPRSDVAVRNDRTPRVEQQREVMPAAPYADSAPAAARQQTVPEQTPAASPSISIAPSKPASASRSAREEERVSSVPRAASAPKVQQSKPAEVTQQSEPSRAEPSQRKPQRVIVRKSDSVRLRMEVKEPK